MTEVDGQSSQRISIYVGIPQQRPGFTDISYLANIKVTVSDEFQMCLLESYIENTNFNEF